MKRVDWVRSLLINYDLSALGNEIISRFVLYTNESLFLFKITHVSIHTSHFGHLNIDGPPFPVKCVLLVKIAYISVRISYFDHLNIDGVLFSVKRVLLVEELHPGLRM